MHAHASMLNASMQKQQRQRCAMPRRPTERLPLVAFSNVAYCEAGGRPRYHVQASELDRVFAALAKANHWSVGDLLANVGFEAGQALECRLVKELPDEWSWLDDSSGYLALHLKASRAVRGFSFLGDEDSKDSDWMPPRGSSRGAAGAPSAKRQRTTAPCAQPAADSSDDEAESLSGAGADSSDDDDDDDDVGRTQPVLTRLHRAAMLAASTNPRAASKLEVRHVCGNPLCAVVSHYRAGTREENDQDAEYHREHGRGRSREGFSPPQ